MAKNIVQRNVDRAREKFADVEDSTERYIKKNPLKSVLIALGVGAVVGASIAVGVESMVKSRVRKKHFWNRYHLFG